MDVLLDIIGAGSLFVGSCGGGRPAFSLQGHTGRMASTKFAASEEEVKLTWKRRYDWGTYENRG
jgi:hypothetical protein